MELKNYIKRISKIAKNNNIKRINIEVGIKILYGEKKMILWVDEKSSNRINFTININK